MNMGRQESDLLEVLRADYSAEAAEHLHAMTAALLDLEKAASDEDRVRILEELGRQAHSLKGESRVVNYPAIEAVCQSLESVFAEWMRGYRPDGAEFDALHRVMDGVQAMRVGGGEGDPAPLIALIGHLAPVRARVPSATSQEESASVPAAPMGPVAPKVSGESRDTAEDTVRMPLARLEALLAQLEELLAVKLTLVKRSEALRAAVAMYERVSRDGKKILEEVTAAGKAGEGISQVTRDLIERNREGVAELRGALAALARESGQDTHAAGRLVDRLLDHSKRMLMLPCATLLGMIPKLVRDLSRAQGKEIETVVCGGDIEIDKRILQELKDAVIHLVRNAVDHGIEGSEERQRKGKMARGTIRVEVIPLDARKVELRVGDDGGGIDAHAVKQVAVRQGLLRSEEAAQMSETDSVNLIFKSSLSTSRVVTTVSGRGLGMAIVKERIDKLGGQIAVETGPGGTCFRMVLPLTLATSRGTFVAAGGRWFVIPSAGVERVGRVVAGNVSQEGGRREVTLGGARIPFVWLSEVLQYAPGPPLGECRSPIAYVVIGAAGGRLVLGVDEVLSEDEVLVKPFAKPLVKVPNMAGATVLASGRVVPVLSVSDLLNSSVRPAAKPLPRVGEAGGGVRKRLLLAEDSDICRTLFRHILEAAGFAVTATEDGRQAWEALQAGQYEAVVSDIEMPLMTGLELMARIRNDPRFATKPVVLITGLGSPEDQERGLELGANAYFVKGSMDQRGFIAALKEMVG